MREEGGIICGSVEEVLASVFSGLGWFGVGRGLDMRFRLLGGDAIPEALGA